MFSARFRSSTAWMYPPTLTGGGTQGQGQEGAQAAGDAGGGGTGGGSLTVLEVEVVGSLGRPQAHGVDHVVAVARHGRVVRQGQHHLQAPWAC